MKLRQTGEKNTQGKRNWLPLIMGSAMVLVVGLILLLFFSAGTSSRTERQVQSELNTRIDMAGNTAQDDLDLVTAHGLRMADEMQSEIENCLMHAGITFNQLDNDAEELTELQQALFPILFSRLRATGCSGAYVALNVTANADAPTARHSRSGLYLRCVNLTDSATTDPDISFFRGIPEVGRRWGMEFNNRWNMEFDTSQFPNFEALMKKRLDRPAQHYFWTEKIHLQDTWEDVILLCVPVVGNDRQIYGVCGLEISSLIFRLFAPVQETEFGPLTMILSPVENGKMMLPKGLIGSTGGTYFNHPEPLTIHRSGALNTYAGEKYSYVGVHKMLDISKEEDQAQEWAAALVMPEAHYSAHSAKIHRIQMAKISVTLVIILLCAALIYHRYLRPLRVKAENQPEINDIAVLVNFVRSRPIDIPLNGEDIPQEIKALLDRFSVRVTALPNELWRLYRFLAEGCAVEDLPRQTGLGKRALHGQLKELCRALAVDSPDDILFYLDFMRRCGQQV